MSAKVSRETSKKQIIKIHKDEKLVVKDVRSTLEQTRKTGNQREGPEKKEKESNASAKTQLQNSNNQLPVESLGSKVLPAGKTKEKNPTTLRRIST